MRFARFVAVAFALIAAPMSAQAQTGTIAGKVKDAAGEPIQGATVSVAGTQSGAITSAAGTYRIALRPGRYEMRVRLLGYAAAKDSVTVTSGQVVTKDFVLNKTAAALEAVAVIGSRGEERTVIDAPVPIDVLSTTDLKNSGRVETAQMIQAAAPSFNFPRPSITDGTDQVRPATLRGLGSDQTLVLINGKRRHSSALVNINGSVGRGQAAVDINAIPQEMIDHIEILRDGAAAQYGSDAIAGVINIVLKKDAANELTTSVGETNSSVGNVSGDGKLFQAAGTYSVPVTNGFLTLAGELRDRGSTNRSYPDTRQQYFTGNPLNSQPAPYDHRFGDAYTHDMYGWYDFGRTLDNGMQVYSFGGLSYRRGDGAGFFRRPNDDRNVRAIYPNGFLPVIQTKVWDGSFGAGIKGDNAGWTWDLGSVWGRNGLDYGVANSLNTSMGASSPLRFDAGGLAFSQWTTDLDLHRNLSSDTRLGIGAEYRMDMFDITAGDQPSWENGGVAILDGPNAGKPAAPGSQVFPGFKPSDAASHSRGNVAAYADLEHDFSKAWLVDFAARGENYSDFGSTVNGKVSTRYTITKGLNLRGAMSTGFRAPSLHQEYFSATSTNFINGVPFDIRTFPVNDPVARVLGSKDLKPEHSVNFSGGFAVEPAKNLSITADYYYITINDRIVFSDNFVGAQVTALLASKGYTGIQGGRYFTNAIDTKTQGVDVVVNYGMDLADAGFLRWTLGYNNTQNQVTNVIPTPPELSTQSEALFGRVERGRIEVGQPRDNAILTANWTRKSLGLTLTGHRYGQVITRGTAADGSLDNYLSPKTLLDVSFDWQTPFGTTIAVGADNLFDTYPDLLKPGTDFNGITRYSGFSPFGFNGRFVYLKLTWTK
ncbi:MAG: TonB-dependent receptor [Proteobacteria bacterium]|nr:TonB-dependent receptor [Pseudomonadota bacterium]